ncbi:MAG: hypothetical protein GY906_11380 [bacterium]|nr:hypothetical protein [bacterium]
MDTTLITVVNEAQNVRTELHGQAEKMKKKGNKPVSGEELAEAFGSIEEQFNIFLSKLTDLAYISAPDQQNQNEGESDGTTT